ncbi:MAG: HAMP domain-containing sensor histidine kinase [Pseudomonadota bacterium]
MGAETTSNGRRPAVLIVMLLGVILATVVGLAWQASRAAKAYDRAAMDVLRDYAGLAADEFTRRATGQIGYYGYFTEINRLRDALSSGAPLPPPGPGGSSPVGVAFTVQHAAPQPLEVSGQGLAPAVADYVLTTLREQTSAALPDYGLLVEHAVIEGEPVTFAFSWFDAAEGFFGFTVDRAWLTSALQTAFDENSLLPESLAGGAVKNDLLYLRVLDRTGAPLFEAGTLNAASNPVDRVLGADYGGVVEGFQLSVAIDPDLGRSLIIGGLPKSRLPVLIVIIVLAALLLMAALWQLQREAAVLRLRSNFVAEVSHELRTPLTQIRMFAESLLYERLPDAGDRHRALTIINRESQRLINLVENILRFSGSGSASANSAASSQNLGNVVRSVVDEFQVLAESTGARIEATIADDVVTTIDADAVRQVLLNLLDNAVKYGPPKQTVHVTLEAREGIARISVADEGPGIPAGERGRIWESYYRLDRERRSAIAGTGIGLAVVAELAAALNGKLHVDDNGGTGARFSLDVPL